MKLINGEWPWAIGHPHIIFNFLYNKKRVFSVFGSFFEEILFFKSIMLETVVYFCICQKVDYFLWFSILASFSFFGRLVKFFKKNENCLFYGNAIFHSKYMPSSIQKNAVHAVKTDQPTNCTRNVCTERPFVLIKCVLEFINLLKDCLVSECCFLVAFAHLSRFITDEDFFPFRINWLLILRFDFIILQNLCSFIIQMQVTR